jgi:hypothetical protein
VCGRIFLRERWRRADIIDNWSVVSDAALPKGNTILPSMDLIEFDGAEAEMKFPLFDSLRN